MSGGDDDVEPSLGSRNKKGNGEPQLKFSKPSATKSVGVGSGQVVVWVGVLERFAEGFAEVRWWWSTWVCGGVGGGGKNCRKMQFGQRKPDDPGQEPDDPGESG